MVTAPLDISLYKQALIVLAAAGVVTPLFHRLRISSVLDFILIGVVVGPFGLGSLTPHLHWLSATTINTPEAIEPIARLGVVLLLFMIGLELSFERIWVMRRLVFGVGSLQVLLCAAMLAGAAVMLGYNRISAVVIGLCFGDVFHRGSDPGAVGREAAQHLYRAHQLRHPAVSGSRGGAAVVRPRCDRPDQPRRNAAGFGLAVG